MAFFYPMKNTIQDYAWGDPYHIAQLLGQANPQRKPMAELWMGAHPSAPSQIQQQGQQINLDAWIATHPTSCLGPHLEEQFGQLPYLFKLLAAKKALSIQAHPNTQQAEEGFQAEEKKRIPRDAPERNYRDDKHKPEIIMALSPFTAMIGFREPALIAQNFKILPTSSLSILLPILDRLEKNEEDALAPFLTCLLGLNRFQRKDLLKSGLQKTKEDPGIWDALQVQWIPRLMQQFPGDVAALAPLFLHLIEIQPYQALYQPARVMHAYLEGFGVELMANSNNVLRGGLTGKNIDLPELTKVLQFRPFQATALAPGPVGKDGLQRFDSPAREFRLALANVKPSSPLRLLPQSGPRILLVLEASLTLIAEKERLSLTRGKSAFIPWDSPEITVEGQGQAVLAEPGL